MSVALVTLCVATASAATEKVIYSFQAGTDGAYPLAALVADANGHLYGTTQGGGTGACKVAPPPGGCGTVFELAPPAAAGEAWVESVIYRFTGGGDGANPWAGLIFDQSGNLYGTAEFGGQSENGVVFELTPPPTTGGAWSETVLYAFKGHRHGDGANPQAGLVFDSHGNLFGTTYAGGIPCSDSAPSGCGTIFELTPPTAPGGAWTEQLIYKFDPSFAGGPASVLVLDASGNLYGTAVNDGALGEGTAYKLSPSGSAWTRTVLHTFGGSGDGGYVYAGLIFGKGGNLYGATTGFGGQVGNGGTVFELARPTTGTAWKETLLTVFPGENGVTEGPWSSLLSSKAGALYGATSSGGGGDCVTSGGWHGCGFVFQLTPPAAPGSAWTETTLYSFQGSPDGAVPYSGLAFGFGHRIYGTTSAGGSGTCFQNGLSGCGTVFEIVP